MENASAVLGSPACGYGGGALMLLFYSGSASCQLTSSPALRESLSLTTHPLAAGSTCSVQDQRHWCSWGRCSLDPWTQQVSSRYP